jgi:hypothetical protein
MSFVGTIMKADGMPEPYHVYLLIAEEQQNAPLCATRTIALVGGMKVAGLFPVEGRGQARLAASLEQATTWLRKQHGTLRYFAVDFD